MDTLHTWAEIKDGFKDTLILGNGSSIAVNPAFLYDSLFMASVSFGLLDAQATEVFKLFETKDFEYVLRLLSHAIKVNHCCEIECQALVDKYILVRDALINTLHRVHPKIDEVRPHFPAMVSFLKDFSTVYSLNYDLIVYWALMHGKDEQEFADYWVYGNFDGAYSKQRSSDSTLFLYPHGNLVLLSNALGKEEKISTGGRQALLDEIARRWSSATNSPLFISEGESQKKMNMIGLSPYLMHVHETLSEPKESVAIHGWSASEQDDHILKALSLSHPQRIAVSLRKCETWQARMVETAVKLRKHFPAATLLFYDADSPGAWIHPT